MKKKNVIKLKSPGELQVCVRVCVTLCVCTYVYMCVLYYLTGSTGYCQGPPGRDSD